MPTAIAVSGLVKHYGDLVAVDDVTFEVGAGEVFALLGPNGAGKTTTVEIVEGLREPDRGSVAVLGHDPRTDRRALSTRIGVMLQGAELYAGIRTREAIELFASFHDHSLEVDDLIERLDLGRVRRTTFRRLSGGERQRLALAIALVGRPDIAFLDEPTAGMDIQGRVRTWELVEQLKADGTTVLLTTHLLDEAERVADRVGIVHRGALVSTGTPAELTSRTSGELTFELGTSIDAADLEAALGERIVSSGPNTYVAEGVAPEPRIVARLADWCAERDVLIRRLDAGRRTLADVYLELTRGETP